MVIRGEQIAPGTGHEEGRKLLSQMYARYAKEPMPEIILEERGKPCFAQGDWHFSISHTDRHVFCALSQRRIGLDAEDLDRPIKTALAEKILSSGEKTQYEQARDKRRALLTFWVLKEALAKCTGEGLRGYLNHTDFSLSDPRVRELHGCLVAVIEEEDNVI